MFYCKKHRMRTPCTKCEAEYKLALTRKEEAENLKKEELKNLSVHLLDMYERLLELERKTGRIELDQIGQCITRTLQSRENISC